MKKMKKIEMPAYYSIKISGAREKDAADYIEKTVEFYMRSYQADGLYDADAITDAIKKAETVYGCKVEYEF